MAFVYYNANPVNKMTGDCTVRAIAVVMGQTWEDTHYDLCLTSRYLYDMPSTNGSWGEYLTLNGFKKYHIQDTFYPGYTIREFCHDHPHGTYLLATGSHVVAVIDGNYYDTWNSGDEVPIYYWRKEK